MNTRSSLLELDKHKIVVIRTSVDYRRGGSSKHWILPPPKLVCIKFPLPEFINFPRTRDLCDGFGSDLAENAVVLGGFGDKIVTLASEWFVG